MSTLTNSSRISTLVSVFIYCRCQKTSLRPQVPDELVDESDSASSQGITFADNEDAGPASENTEDEAEVAETFEAQFLKKAQETASVGSRRRQHGDAKTFLKGSKTGTTNLKVRLCCLYTGQCF